jgi:hypothetical protein
MSNVRQFLEISTSHVPDSAINQPGGLNAIEGVIAYAYEHGSWLWVPDNVDEHLRDYDDFDSVEIEAIWRHARELDCDWVRLDADGDQEAELAVFQW